MEISGYNPNQWGDAIFPYPMGYLPIAPSLPPNMYGPVHFPFYDKMNMDIQSMMENPLHPIYTDPPQFQPYVPVVGNSFNEHPIIQAFKTENGSLDFQKMINTANQILGTLQQTSSLIKGISQIFKG
ncbi:YppG family protein [Fervidibacillus halotolerans]|uniref:YppG family protein n=1 Tax=Fervidibacillus halotolerans TaxID=2980027 RepID=A0A9E8RYE2_9BACI|nr:YppG family protein [Fervidibacillus halotolerans]WAA13725.1 YppG family protein [Fervidibacillus halotolerans]